MRNQLPGHATLLGTARERTASAPSGAKKAVADLKDEVTRARVQSAPRINRAPTSYAVFTTLLDLFFAVCVILFLGWLFLLIALAIRVDSRGPAVLRQFRVGKAKKVFVCWKFRTMHLGSAHRATHEMSSSSITKVGAFLRRTKLDELPQVINLLRREISLVGPRPCLPIQTELIEKRDERGVYDVRPGITGYAQINDVDMSDPERLARWDARYCALRSIPFDLKVLLATFLGGGRGDRVGV